MKPSSFPPWWKKGKRLTKTNDVSAAPVNPATVPEQLQKKGKKGGEGLDILVSGLRLPGMAGYSFDNLTEHHRP
ncbi:hypothetical protein TNCT_308601 [Trichonephila clavata]|uniref:Uncharacterized protein n=1 Tax=Trichonephila clavata TaxID=2740835 RepID=A0A8X6HRK2_TRICU|nr:hypothetical protein TNCT_308601 [Trichonephila clavata]